jgi:hypothetical protein
VGAWSEGNLCDTKTLHVDITALSETGYRLADEGRLTESVAELQRKEAEREDKKIIEREQEEREERKEDRKKD